MATLPALNPAIPYLGLVPGGLRPGLMIRITGRMTNVGNRFNINIQSGAALRPRDDVALHISVRPSEHAIVRNHFERQIWGTEERYGSCPISIGHHFDILILAESSAYKIAINGSHFCLFNHRLSVNRAQYVSVEGDVHINSIQLEGDIPTAPIMPYQPPYQNFQSGHTGVVHHMVQTGPTGVGHFPHVQSGTTGYIPPPPPYSPPLHHGYRPPYMQPRLDAGSHGVATPYTMSQPHSYPFQSNVYYNPSPVPVAYNYPTHAAGVGSNIPGTQYYRDDQDLKKKKRNKALKYAAGVGGIGLGAYALSRAFAGGSGSDGDSD